MTWRERTESWADLRVTLRPFPWHWRLHWMIDRAPEFDAMLHLGPITIEWWGHSKGEWS